MNRPPDRSPFPLHAVLILGLCAACVPAQAGGTGSGTGDAAAAGKATAAEILARFAAEKIQVDLAAGTVTVPAVVNAPPDPIEYLLIHRTGKRHEAMFYTLAKPSILNAALLLLGLQPGKNATYRAKDPPPTQEEFERGADPLVVTPPSGTELWMTVAWVDAQGERKEYCIEDLLADLTTQEPVRDASWIYLGGRMATVYKGDPEMFIADLEGNLVSVCYLTPDNHIATMRHERARDDQNWWLTDKVPEPGTEVQFTFHRGKSALHVARERRLAEEDKEKEKEKEKEKAGKDAKAPGDPATGPGDKGKVEPAPSGTGAGKDGK